MAFLRNKVACICCKYVVVKLYYKGNKLFDNVSVTKAKQLIYVLRDLALMTIVLLV